MPENRARREPFCNIELDSGDASSNGARSLTGKRRLGDRVVRALARTTWRWAPPGTQRSRALPAHEFRRALGVVALVFAVKLGLGGIWFDLEGIVANGFAFGFEVGHIAGNIAAGHGFTVSPDSEVYLPTAWVSPLYPLMLAGIFKLFGAYSLAAAKAMLVANCLFQAASAGLLYLLGVRFGGRSVGLVAACIFLVNPNGWQFLAWAWPSQLFAFLLLLHFYSLLFPIYRSAGLVGATFALALMADGAAIAVAPVTLAHLYFGNSANPANPTSATDANRVRRRSLAAALICFAIVVAPWTIRNAQQFGSINPLRGNVGVNLWVGNYPGANDESFHGLAPSPWHDAAEGKKFVALGERGYDRMARDRALAEIVARPGRFVVNSLTRFSGFWLGEWWAGYQHIAWFYSLGLIALTALALRGAIRARKLGTGALLAAVLLFGGPYYLTVHGHGRYRVPIEPLMCLLAALKPGEAERESSLGDVE